jgi:hypothetical protein
MTILLARETLEAARFFSAQAAASRAGDPAFRYFLEAAIVFARSVTFHLQKEFSKEPAFSAWYDQWRDRMGQNAACAFFLYKRNFVLKEGRVTFNYNLPLDPGAFVSSFGELTFKVIRGRPWYRRPLWQLREDGIRTWRQLLDRTKRRREKRRSLQQGPLIATYREPVAGFVDFRPNEDAVDVLIEYLDYLDDLVSDAEKKFLH